MTSTSQQTEETKMDTATGWACQDCVMLLANGETNPWWTEEETAAYLDRVTDQEVTLGFDADEHDEDCPNHGEWIGAECYCEHDEFSWRRCDVCGSTLGGYRHAVTFWFTGENA
jgi:hypothetical protein